MIESSEVRARRMIRRLREGSYSSKVNGASVSVPFTDAETTRDVHDLYVVLSELHSSGSPNLEIQQARQLIAGLEEGRSLSTVEQALLGRLLARHASEIRALRRSPDKQGQDFAAVPTAGTGR
jgi:hypothetical protein